MDGTLLGHMSLLPWQTILEVRKQVLVPKFEPELSAKWILVLSFQQ